MPSRSRGDRTRAPGPARVLLHAAHLATFAVLTISGFLLFVPDLRAMITGGYSLVIRKAHCWVGVLFAVLPVPIVLRHGPGILFGPSEGRTPWKNFHVAITLAMGVALTLSGFVLWGKEHAPEGLVDASWLVHDWVTYAAVTMLGVHLVEAGLSALITRLRSPAGMSPDR